MKNLFLTCMVLFLAFIFGCQESSITDPTQQLAEDQDAKVNNNDLFQDKPDDVNRNIISLKYELDDPTSGDACELTGQVTYENTTIPSIGDPRKVMVKVELRIFAELLKLRGPDHLMWKIEKKSEDNVLLSNTEDPQTKKLYKAYTFTNRDDVKLFVTYLITSKSVQIVEIFLGEIDVVEDDDATN